MPNSNPLVYIGFSDANQGIVKVAHQNGLPQQSKNNLGIYSIFHQKH